MSKRRTQRFHKLVEADLEIMPLMNLFVVLIPMLLLSAVFVEVAAIRMAAPGDSTETDPATPGLELAVAIQSDSYVVSGRVIASQTIPRSERNDTAAMERLRSALETIATDHPGNESLRIVSENSTKYDEIVSVMDQSREAGFPQISLESGGAL